MEIHYVNHMNPVQLHALVSVACVTGSVVESADAADYVSSQEAARSQVCKHSEVVPQTGHNFPAGL